MAASAKFISELKTISVPASLVMFLNNIRTVCTFSKQVKYELIVNIGNYKELEDIDLFLENFNLFLEEMINTIQDNAFFKAKSLNRGFFVNEIDFDIVRNKAMEFIYDLITGYNEHTPFINNIITHHTLNFLFTLSTVNQNKLMIIPSVSLQKVMFDENQTSRPISRKIVKSSNI